MRGLGGLGALGGMAGGDEPLSATAQVKAAMAAAGSGASTEKRSSRDRAFSFDTLSAREKVVAPLLGIYLGFAVARLHERFPVLQVPYLLWILMAIMLLTVIASLPGSAWRLAWKNSPQMRMVAILTVLAVVTVPLGIWMTGALDYLVNRFTIVIAVYLACMFLLRDSKVLRRILAMYVAIATVVAVANLNSYWQNDLSTTLLSTDEAIAYQETGEVNTEKLRQTFGSLDPNDIAAVMATTLPLALWLATGSARRRVIWTPCALILVLAIIPTSSRGGLLGLAAAALVLILVGTQGARRIALTTTVALGAVAFNLIAGAKMDRMSNFGGSDYNFTSSEGRIAIWKRGIVWMFRRPWGYGLDNFPVYFGWLNGPDRAAHNSLIQYGVELGLLGLFAYLTICYTLVKSLMRIRRTALKSGVEGRDTATLCGHVLAMLAACWTTGFFLSNAYYPLTYMAIGIASAVVLSKSSLKQDALPEAAPAKPAVPPGRRRRQLKAFQAA